MENQDINQARTRFIDLTEDYGFKIAFENRERPVKDRLLREAHVTVDGGKNILSDKLNFLFLQLPAVKSVTESSSFLERWAWHVRHIHEFAEKPEGLDEYFSLLFDAADRNNISSHKLSIYDRMQRDEIQIEAEKRYAIEEARAEEREKALAEGEARGKAEGEAKGKAEVARAMLREELPLETIYRVTGLTEAQVRSIAQAL